MYPRHFTPVTVSKPSETSASNGNALQLQSSKRASRNSCVSHVPEPEETLKTRFFLPLIVVLCLAGLALAQTDTARLFGTITDSTGAVIPNATVTATETATGRTVSAKTGAAGDYVLYVYAVAKPFLFNQISAAVAFTAP